MNKRDQVITLEQALRLQELGVNADSLFIHIAWSAHNPGGGTLIFRANGFDKNHQIQAPAYTLSELYRGLNMDYAGALMPSLMHFHNWLNDEHINHKSAASLHAALLIHFIENKVFTADKINERINAD